LPDAALVKVKVSAPHSMAALTQADLDKAAHSLNGRPRHTLDGMTPSEQLAEVLQ
jgi:IS30 family transposase